MAQAGRLCYTKQCKDHSAFNSVSPFSAAKNFLRFTLRLSLHFDCARGRYCNKPVAQFNAAKAW